MKSGDAADRLKRANGAVDAAGKDLAWRGRTSFCDRSMGMRFTRALRRRVAALLRARSR